MEKYNVFIAPPGIKGIDYDPTNSIQFYKKMGFKEGWIGCPPLQTSVSKTSNKITGNNID